MNEPNPSLEELLFETALTKPSAGARAAFLDGVCRGNPTLRERLDLLLEGHFQAEAFLTTDPKKVEERPAQPTTADEATSTFIGRYKLLEKIGEGGFGDVWMAEQKEPVKRRVALKIIKLGMDTKQVVARFEAERQALALMEHPNIAKVFDGGATETGRPYFVMELVRGVRITEYCDQNHLTTCDRLKLFIQVCRAIQHAHLKGIIHRDIKPSNILVTEHDEVSVPKVIDFGIAKATQQELTDKTLFTQFRQFLGTPAYISPEQAELSGSDIDTRSDIYSLGVLLYELLTGKTPFEQAALAAAGLAGLRRTIQEAEPVRPSTRLRAMTKEELTTTAQRRRAEASKLISLVRGDLDWIAMKCLEKDRARRYETANGLAQDIERHIDNEPVSARPPSRLYEFQKTVRRHWVGFAAGASVLAVLAGGVIVSTLKTARARRSELTAREQAEIARSVKDFLVEQLLGRVRSYIEPHYDTNSLALLRRVARSLEGAFTNQPLVEAEVRYALGDALGSEFDLWGEALQQSQRAFQIRHRLLGPSHSDTLRAAADVGEELERLGRLEEAEEFLTNVIALARGAGPLASVGAGEALIIRARILEDTGRSEEAIPAFREVSEVFKRAGARDHVSATIGMMEMAQATVSLGHTNEAERLWDELIQRSTRLYGAESQCTAESNEGRGRLFLREGRSDEALRDIDSALKDYSKLLPPYHGHILSARTHLAEVYERLGQTNRAVELYIDVARGWAT
jgi:serine/threonine protein kinase